MFLSIQKTFMVLLLAVTFIGQVMASSIMPYHMMSMSGMNGMVMNHENIDTASNNSNHHQKHSMAMMDHSAHMAMANADVFADKVESDPADPEQCCAKNCNCFVGQCSSTATLIKISASLPIVKTSVKISFFTTQIFNSYASSLYRPPIIS